MPKKESLKPDGKGQDPSGHWCDRPEKDSNRRTLSLETIRKQSGGHLLVSLFVSNVAVQIWIECVWGFSTKGATWKAAVACYQSCFVMKRRNAQGNFRVYTHRQKNRRDWCTILLWSHGVQTQRRGAHGSIKDSVQKENVPKYFGWVSS